MAQHRATTVVPLSGLRLGVAALLVSMATGALLGACDDGTRTPSPSPLPTTAGPGTPTFPPVAVPKPTTNPEEDMPVDEYRVPSLSDKKVHGGSFCRKGSTDDEFVCKRAGDGRYRWQKP